MRGVVKRAITRVVRRLGYEIVPRGDLERRALALHLENLFRKLDIRCVLDVGANRGQYVQFLRERVGYRGLVVSFEPISQNLVPLRKKAQADPQWIIRGHALGSEDTRLEINVMKVDLLSSFLSPHPAMVEMFRDVNVIDHKESVEVRRLDSVMAELADGRNLGNLYLKVDTQGFYLEVIRGAAATLPRVRALQTEISMRPLYLNAPSFRETLDVLLERSFAVSGMFPVVRDPAMRVVEFDCVMVNSAG
jgi:FkbM family methyltransferase